ncbi:MAG: hypothetical protein J3K34DRAFT_391735 [Monoraphidium minutum]|nr:MAG: hypothetical protein J3K34DRAFT_391735 [Monoraphidium minutum]
MMDRSHGAAEAPRPVDATRVLNLFGYVGPVASLMTHTLLAYGHHHGGGAPVAPAVPRVQRLPGLGSLQRSPSSSSGGASPPGRTRFVLSKTEDAIDSVLPCAAERMFRRPGKFGTASNLRFTYHS